ncbi:alpha-N-acetylglucosaminidase [Trichoplusia ni]|uniref:Alpha-N-acetylglucosaminidase n=1 Tax=Trichoplusia ni TaxID=7111 RepID=A0A7E5W6Z3_TRINI|nr:alpha-N-acetylglucosaminidase [Trichoplusia ni]
MWRSILLTFLFGATLVTALNLKYLDPTKLQTKTSARVQKKAALEIIAKYNEVNDYSSLNVDVQLEIDPMWFKDNKDTFKIETYDRTLNIKASTGLAAVWGFNYYIKKYWKSQIEWQSKRIQVPMDIVEVNETVVANDRFRYYQNVCTASYSFVWWNLDDWMKHVEWMALNGINLSLAPVAQEAAWQRIYLQLGMTQDQIDRHFTGPAFLSWLRMGNVHGWGGPLPNSWHVRQTEIQENVTRTMLNLGIVPVLPAFNGHVPVSFAKLFPNSTFHRVEQWNKFGSEYCCGLFLDPSDPLFSRIGNMFLKEVTKGSTQLAHIYTADPFNEVKLSEFSTAMVQETATKIFSTLSDFDKDAVWLLQNWMFVSAPILWPVKRVQAFINSVPNGRMLILDLQSEQWPQYDLYEMYFGQPFIWCMLHNFGGTLGMFGNMVTVNRDVYEVRSRMNSTMIGVGLTPEGINQNYVVYDLMLESAWRKSPVQDLEAWVADYAERRYGCKDAGEAWKYLLKSVYSFNGINRVRGKYVVTRRPSFRIKPWAWYKSYDLFMAFQKLLFATNCYSDGYVIDLIDVTRQALQYRAEQLYINVVNDRYTNAFVFESSVNRFLGALYDMSSILSYSDQFSLRIWEEKAMELGNNTNEADLYAFNARNQITLWGPNGEISDYACKQWSEVFDQYYYQRWSMFLSAAVKAKQAGEVFDEQATRRVVTANVEVPFARMTFKNPYSSYSSPLETAKELYKKWVTAPDVEDLPIIIIKSEFKGRTTVRFDDETDEPASAPSVVMYTNSTESDELSYPSVVMYPTTPVN